MSKPPPPHWGEDSLSDYLERAYRNQHATFANKGAAFKKLRQIDECFQRVATDWADPENELTALLFLRAHTSFRSACAHAASGQTPDVFPDLRACLEAAAYALHVHRNPDLGMAWLGRHNGSSEKAEVRRAFSQARLKDTLEDADPAINKVFSEIYERSIDFGAHPNERAITGALSIASEPGRQLIQHLYMQGDGLQLDHALRSVAQGGACALEILKYAFGPRFDLLGIEVDLADIKKGL